MIRTVQTGPHSYAQGELVKDWTEGDAEWGRTEHRATVRLSDGTEVTGTLVERNER